MTQSIATIALVVDDYDAAIQFYCDKLGFALVEDRVAWQCKAQRAAIGNQAGGRVMLFLETDDFARDHARMLESGVTCLEAPRHEPYGSVAVFADFYGNRWDLIEPRR